LPHLTRTLCLAGALSLVISGQAGASGFMVRENSAESIATVFAGDASRADDLATVFNNPAGMSEFQGTQMAVGSVVVVPQINFSGNVTAGGTTLPGDNSRQNGQIALIPHFYGVFDIDDRTKAGLAITAPFGNTLDYGDTWSGRYVNTKTGALALDINPNISYRITDRVSIGGGVSLQYFKLSLDSGIAQSLIFGPGTPDSAFGLSAANWNWGYNLGILAEPWDGTRVGLTYRSAIAHKLNGVLRFAPDTSPLLGLSTAPASSNLHLPASITGSVTQAIDSDLTLSSDVQFTQWHVFQDVSVVAPPNPLFVFTENYRDSWMVSVGGTYRIDDTWTMRAGVGYDESPVTDDFRDTGVPDDDRYMVGAGPGIHLNETMILDLGYARYFGAAATMNKSVNAVDPFAGSVLHGNYKNALNYLAATFRTTL
jgi:long-chain fatty acid transport protein